MIWSLWPRILIVSPSFGSQMCMQDHAPFDLFSAGCAFIIRVTVCPCLPGWALATVVTGCLGAVEGRLSPAGQRSVKAAGAKTLPYWQKGKPEGLGLTDLCWHHSVLLLEAFHVLPVSVSWCLTITLQGRLHSQAHTLLCLLASLSSLRCFPRGREYLLADLCY